MQQFLFVTIIIVIAMIALGMLTYFLLPNKRSEANNEEAICELRKIDDNDEGLDKQESVTLIEVKFKGYHGRYTYSILHDNVRKDQYVLVLTQDGIRCAKVVTHPKRMRVSELPFPPFLLQSIICVADESDLDYYSS